MNIFLNLDGTAQIVSPVSIYQGSNAVTNIVVQSYMPLSTAMELFFILPDENKTKAGPFVMASISPSSGTDGLNYWSWSLLKGVTALAGTVDVIINAISGAPPDLISGTQQTTSFSCAFEVVRGVLPTAPVFPPTQDQWQLIMQYVQGAYSEAHEAQTAVNPIKFKTTAISLPSNGAAYVDLQLIYNGLLIKQWSSETQSWLQINPNPDPLSAIPSLWLYNFIIGLPRSDIAGPPGPSVAAGAQNIVIYASDFVGSSAPYSYVIPPLKHRLGETPNIGVFCYSKIGAVNSTLYESIEINDNGIVTIYANAPFNGMALLVAGVMLNPQLTDGLRLTNPTTESISGLANTQNIANVEFVTAINSISQGGKFTTTQTIPISGLLIPYTEHLKLSPTVTVLDSTTGQLISQNYVVDTNNNVTITTNQAFNAKIIIF